MVKGIKTKNILIYIQKPNSFFNFSNLSLHPLIFSVFYLSILYIFIYYSLVFFTSDNLDFAFYLANSKSCNSLFNYSI